MSRVTTYLNFMGDAEEAFGFYGSVFGTKITGDIFRIGDMGGPDVKDSEKNLVAHAELPILAGHVLMGSDVVESMGHELKIGNNVTINLEADSRDELDGLCFDTADLHLALPPKPKPGPGPGNLAPAAGNPGPGTGKPDAG